MATVRVWRLAIRLAHWALAGCVLACLVLYQGGHWHERLGYVALAIIVWRIAGGLGGPAADRFSAFVRGPAATLAYARALWRGDESRHLGHNPLGAWMILALLATALLAAGSGAVYLTDAYWGEAALYRLHQIAGWSLAGLVPLHLGGVALSSWRQRENLIMAMLSGRKRAPAPGPDDGA